MRSHIVGGDIRLGTRRRAAATVGFAAARTLQCVQANVVETAGRAPMEATCPAVTGTVPCLVVATWSISLTSVRPPKRVQPGNACRTQPDLNPVEGIWSLLRRSTTANVVFRDRDHLVRAVRSGLRRIQQRTDLLEGCLAETGLSLNTTTERKGQ